jgi:type VI secretion system Hcp family effector
MPISSFDNAFAIYMSIKGALQGQFKGDSTMLNRASWYDVVRLALPTAASPGGGTSNEIRIGAANALNVSNVKEIQVGGAKSPNVSGGQTTLVGGAKSSNVSGGQTTLVGDAKSPNVSGGQTTLVGDAMATNVSRAQTVTVGRAITGVTSASGRRVHQPIVITRQLGSATPQIWQALTTDEVLTQIVFEVTRKSNGIETVSQRYLLTNAKLVYVRPRSPSSGVQTSGTPLQDIAVDCDSYSIVAQGDASASGKRTY